MEELTKESFEEKVSQVEGPVLVDWWGDACTACKAFMPTMEEIAVKYDGKMPMYKFNTSQKGCRRFCIKQRILGLPVIGIYKNGEKVDEVVKETLSRENVEAMIEKHLQ
ncbi:thioredoxin [Atopobacter sp. AH10]|uniref:thioredoxin family protein n=1 Tax=Atopobacter sp. AH10 TaxID=2315861 RepID=UPI000EF24114|nr:thioredoxin domain-containing protein [Atopobacter sp. AH10]RLK64108.1 thioredoxin [Atopobacter sp. AH10]